MLIDTDNYQFWLVGSLWCAIPIMSWVWSLVCIKKFKEFGALISETQTDLIKVRSIHKEACQERLESRKLKEIAEQELKSANEYYIKIKQLLENQ